MSYTNALSHFKNISKSSEFLYNKPYVKKFGSDGNFMYKITIMKCVKNSSVESVQKNFSSKGSVNDFKLAENVSRAKNKIFELAFCNSWDFFFTGTLDSKKYNRTDLEKFHKDFTLFIRNFNRNHNCKIKFLVVPELHSDGKSWHLHGFLMGLPLSELSQFKIGDTMGKAIAEKVSNGDTVFNWVSYQNKFGFCDLEPIKNHEAVSKYITKYINKELADNVTKLNAHLFYHSRGLSFAENVNIKNDLIDWYSIKPSFENDYCSLVWLSEKEYNSLRL